METALTVDTTLSDRKAADALTTARALIIGTPEEYSKADAYCKGLYNLRREIEADFAESEAAALDSKKKATEALATLVAQKKSHTQPVLEAEKVLKGKLLVWRNEDDRKRREEQDSANAEARKKAEDEQLRKAEALQAQGKTSQAEAVLNKPTKVQPVIVPSAAPKAQTVIRTTKHYRVVDPDAVKRNFCAPDAGKMWREVQNSGLKAAEIIGGVEVWEEAA